MPCQKLSDGLYTIEFGISQLFTTTNIDKCNQIVDIIKPTNKIVEDANDLYVFVKE